MMRLPAAALSRALARANRSTMRQMMMRPCALMHMQPRYAAVAPAAAASSSARNLFKSTRHRQQQQQQQQQQHEDSSSAASSAPFNRWGLLLAGGLTLLAAYSSTDTLSAAAANPPPRDGDRGSSRNHPPSPPAPEWLGTRLCEAASVGDVARLEKLLTQYAPIEGINLTHRYGWTPLQAAVANGQAEVVRFILSRPELQINKIDRYSPRARNLTEMIEKHTARQDCFPELYPSLPANSMSALHYAALFAPVEIVDMLIEAGADINQVDQQGFTADKLIDFSSVPDSAEGGGGTLPSSDANLVAKKQHHALVAGRIAAARASQEARRLQQEKEDRIRFPLELKLKKEMIGQEVPILSVSAAIRRRENGWFDASKPLVFLFLGSSGVGKTMLAKLLAQHVVKDDEDGFIRIDMSEFQAKHEMSRLIGSPPGYVGHESGGQLTEKLAKCPRAVVLLDEVEKAHPDILTLLLAVFDEGRLTDGKGKTIHCPEAIFVMTSNVVQEEIRDALESGYELRPQQSILEDLHRTTAEMRTLGGFTTTPLPPPKDANNSAAPSVHPPSSAAAAGSKQEELVAHSEHAPSVTTTTILPGAMPVMPINHQDAAAAPAPSAASSSSSPEHLSRQLAKLASDTERFLRFVVHPILKRSFKRDEFIGRINDTILFHPFSKQDLEATVTMELNRWATRAKQRHNIDLSWTPALVDSLTLNFDERYGYRSVIYAVERRVVNVLASAHERDLIASGCAVQLDLAETPTQPGQQPSVVIREVKRPSGSGSGNSKEEAGRKKFLGIF